MIKGHVCISLDTNIIELIRLKRQQDPDFNISELVNDFLYNLLSNELKDYTKQEMEKEKVELEKKLATLKSRQQSLEKTEAKQKDKDDLEWIKEIDRKNGIR
jgi:excinuclease UvrABC helicase subunit UvrB